MNHSYCCSHKKTPYELVYGDKPHGNCTLIEDLFSKGIYDEENIPETIKIDGHEYTCSPNWFCDFNGQNYSNFKCRKSKLITAFYN